MTVEVTVDIHAVEITAETEIVERTGIEMEAMTACAVAALSIFDVLSGTDPEASIEHLTLWHKSGGRSGDWQRSALTGEFTRIVESRATENQPEEP